MQHKGMQPNSVIVLGMQPNSVIVLGMQPNSVICVSIVALEEGSCAH